MYNVYQALYTDPVSAKPTRSLTSKTLHIVFWENLLFNFMPTRSKCLARVSVQIYSEYTKAIFICMYLHIHTCVCTVYIHTTYVGCCRY